MKYLIALFTSKVVTDKTGKAIYVDPITKNGYLLKGNLARQKNILPIRFVFSLFAFFVLYSFWPKVEGYSTLPLFAVICIIGLIAFEVYLYKKILPNCNIYPNYEVQENKNTISGKKRLLLIVSYIILGVALCIHAFMKQDTMITLAVSGLLIVTFIRLNALLNK